MEICICAAVKTTDGQIIRGHRHIYCMGTIASMGLKRQNSPEAEGFITSHNRYVTREEGQKIQLAAGLPSARGKYAQNGELRSEDLY